MSHQTCDLPHPVPMLEASVSENLRQNDKRNVSNDRRNVSKKAPIKARKFKRSAEKQKVEEVDKSALEYVSGVFFHHRLILIGPSADSSK